MIFKRGQRPVRQCMVTSTGSDLCAWAGQHIRLADVLTQHQIEQRSVWCWSLSFHDLNRRRGDQLQ